MGKLSRNRSSLWVPLSLKPEGAVVEVLVVEVVLLFVTVVESLVVEMKLVWNSFHETF